MAIINKRMQLREREREKKDNSLTLQIKKYEKLKWKYKANKRKEVNKTQTSGTERKKTNKIKLEMNGKLYSHADTDHKDEGPHTLLYLFLMRCRWQGKVNKMQERERQEKRCNDLKFRNDWKFWLCISISIRVFLLSFLLFCSCLSQTFLAFRDKTMPFRWHIWKKNVMHQFHE